MRSINIQYPISNIKYLLFFIAAFFCFLNVSNASADYYAQGVLASGNLLSGAQTVSAISSFKVTGTVPANTTVSIKFSQDNVNYYNSSGTKEGWDSCANGTTTISIAGLGWSQGSLFYKIQLTTTDINATPTVGEVELVYTGTIVPPLPASPFYAAGAMVSTDLLSAGTAGTMTGVDRFGYTVSSLPYGTSVLAQFSRDGTNWYSSSGTLWGLDTLVFGDHLSPTTALSLSALNWKGATSFYYKLTFLTAVDNNTSPVVKDAGLLEFSAIMGGSADTSADPIAWYKFDEGVGTTAYNSGSGGASLNGSLNPGSSAPTWSNDGKFGKALSFNGTNYVSTTAMTGADSLSAATLSAWVYVGSLQYQFTGIVETRAASLVALGINPGGSANKVWFDWDGTMYSVDTGYVIPNNKWTLLTVTFNSSGVILYANGARVFSYSKALNTQNENGIWNIGRDPNTYSDRYFNGKIDDVKIYNYALTADQVKREYNGGYAMMLGSLGGGSAPNGASAEYCVPGDTTTCSAPVGEWKMDTGVGTTAYDTSGNGNNGSITGATWTQGKFGKGLNFDGTSNYINLPNSMPLVANATQLTVSTWFFSRTKDNAYHRISDGIDQEKYQLALWAGDIINWSVKTSGGVRTSSVPSTAWSAGQWNFIVGTYDGIATKVYLNGQLADSDTWNEALNIPTTGTTRIGSSFQSLQFFNGLIDNFRIYNYARTPAQIAWEYNKGKPVGWWRFNECTGSTVHDESGNGNNGTINLGASGQTTAGTCTANANTPWYNGRTGKYNASLNFDGTDDYVDMGTVPTFTNNVVSESTWFYRRSNSSDYECIVSIGNSGTESYGAYSICSMADGKIRAHAEYSYSMYIESDNVVSNNVWHNAAMVSDGSNYYLYIDGVRQKASRPSSNPVANFFRIGGSVMSAEYFDGQIDDVKIFNYALTADQVKTLYNDASAVNFGN